MRLFLEFDSAQPELSRVRLNYAFRLFCAVYGHTPLSTSGSGSADVRVSYRGESGRHRVRLAPNYQPRCLTEPARPPVPFASANGPQTVLIHGNGSPNPDWLGEVFEWVSCADEYAIRDRDSVGRLPFRASYCGRHGLSSTRPYAALAMHSLQRSLELLVPACGKKASSPVAPWAHAVVNTHDVDYLGFGRCSLAARTAKNALISLLERHDLSLAARQALKVVQALYSRPDANDHVMSLARGDRQLGADSTFFFLPHHRHRRDGNYEVGDPRVAAVIRSVCAIAEVGLHTSYTCMNSPGGVRREVDEMAAVAPPLGMRQHWLRFTVGDLISEVADSGLAYDTSLGWSDVTGFRAGACFPFPPYDFRHEGAAEFLEFPLAIMDVALPASGEEWAQVVQEVLAISREYSWGGFSALWHPTAFGSMQLPRQIEELYWRLLSEAAKHNEGWTGAGQLYRHVQPRYEQAGFRLRAVTSTQPARSAAA